MIERPETGYATTVDGLSIAYQTWGDGANLVCVPGTASHLDLFWDLPGIPGRRLRERLGRVARCAFFDKRGTGLSDRSFGTGSLEDRMEDVRAVMDAAGMESATLLGISEGGPMAVLFAASCPERVDRLVVFGGYAVGRDVVTPERIRVYAEQWGSGTVMREHWCAGIGDLAELGRMERAMNTPRAIAEFMTLNGEIDVRPVLGTVTAPALVIETDDRVLAPGQVRPFVDISRELADGMPDARLELLPGRFHGTSDLADADRVIDLIEEFVTGSSPADRAGAVIDRVLSTVVFTDLVGSTRRAAVEGDQRWSRMLEDHDRICRDVLGRFRGRWVKSTGDGMLATFDGPARAIAAVEAIGRELRTLGLEIRAGVHTGEIELRGDDIAGLGVNIAARVMHEAGDGETWVSSTVPGLAVGSGIGFERRGAFELKGVPGAWELFAARTAA